MRSRTRLIAIVASLLVCIAMVGTGFASWVILDKKTDTGTGNVSAEAVSVGAVELTVPEMFTGPIVFGSPVGSSGVSGTDWLVEDQTEGQGQYKATADVTIKGKASMTVKLDLPQLDGNITFAELIEQKILAAPTLTISEKTTSTIGGTITLDNAINLTTEGCTIKFNEKTAHDFTETTTLTFTLTFGWGELFKAKSGTGATTYNPYYFFNEQSQTGTVDTTNNFSSLNAKFFDGSKIDMSSGVTVGELTWAQAATALLGKLNSILPTETSKAYTVTVTATAVTSVE